VKILDLFCCAGGASMGIHRAGHQVEGVDFNKEALDEYPFDNTNFDITKLTSDELRKQSFDAFFASPPCQHYSYATTQWRNLGNEYPDLIDFTRKLLLGTGKPFVLENVVGSPLRRDLMLCMSMFDDGRQYVVRRHRIFEIHGFDVPQPEHRTHIGRVGDGRVISVFGHGGGQRYNHATSDKEAWKIAMGMPWVNRRRNLTEAIPPEYTEYIFSYLK
jgi:site-specific DNA-cytosine methylase